MNLCLIVYHFMIYYRNFYGRKAHFMTFREYLIFNNFKKKSIKAHLYKINKLKKFDQTTIHQYIFMLFETNRTTATVNKYINTYKLYGKYLQYTKQATKVDLEWLNELKHYKEAPRQRIVFSNLELQKFLSYDDRYSLYFKILARTGARPMEIASLKKSDVDFANNFIMIQESKTGEGRTVPLPEDLVQEFYNYIEDNDSSWCFPIKTNSQQHITLESLRKAFKIRREKLQLNRALTPYCLRHTFITRMLAAGAPLFVIQSIVGHKNASTTAKYFHLNQQMQKEAMQRDPLIWNQLSPTQKLNTVKKYICNLGLDIDAAFNLISTNFSIVITIKNTAQSFSHLSNQQFASSNTNNLGLYQFSQATIR